MGPGSTAVQAPGAAVGTCDLQAVVREQSRPFTTGREPGHRGKARPAVAAPRPRGQLVAWNKVGYNERHRREGAIAKQVPGEGMIGQTLSNRYKLIGELGNGGMAWVYLAQDQVQDRTVAVKILYPQHSQDFGFVQRFIREARLSMSLSQSARHPNIVCVLDYGADRDTHYLVMEYVPGQDLGKILEERGTLPWQTALDLARQVALALDHAHSHEIVHRDIKPSNIMVLPDGTARILDLGIARARTSPELTLSGFVGSPHYAAPEQVTRGPLDIRADVYSLGVVLYRMLSGSLPFEGDTPWEVVNQQIAAEPPALAERRPDLPRSVVRLVQKAMAKRPKDRFQTPAEMVQALELVLAGQELPADLFQDPDPAAELEELYQDAVAAMEAERWQEAVDHLSRVVKVDPEYRDVSLRLGEVGQQIRLSSLYRSAQRALEQGQWEQALAHLDKIEELAPGYKNVAEMLAAARSREKPPTTATAPASEFPTQVPETPANAAAGPPPAPVTASPAPAARRRPGARHRTGVWAAVAILVAGGLLAALLLSNRGPAFPSAATPGPTEPATAAVQGQASTPEEQTTAGLEVTGTAVAAITPRPEPSRPSPTATRRPTRTAPPAAPTLLPTVSATAAPGASPSAAEPGATPGPGSTPALAVASPEPALAGQIAFPRFDPARGTYDIHVCAVDGTNCRLVAAEASQPDLLPDGTRLVFHSWKSDDQGLILQTLGGQRVWRISSDLEAARPSVDFRGEIYVYHSRQQADRQPRLYRTYDADTRPLRREASDVLGRSPTWTPDGQILYSGCVGDTCGILLARADGSYPRQVAAGSNELAAEASPDGRQVAFMSQRDGNWEVYVSSLSGGAVQRLTDAPGNDGLPAWSPDGRFLAFVSDRGGSWAVWAMRPDGSGQRRLFAIGGTLDGRVRTAVSHQTHGWLEERISWSPAP